RRRDRDAAGDAARGIAAELVSLGLRGGMATLRDRRTMVRRHGPLLDGVHELVTEQRIARTTAEHAVGDVDITAERDRSGAVLCGHPIPLVELDAAEVRTELSAEVPRLRAIELGVGFLARRDARGRRRAGSGRTGGRLDQGLLARNPSVDTWPTWPTRR